MGELTMAVVPQHPEIHAENSVKKLTDHYAKLFADAQRYAFEYDEAQKSATDTVTAAQKDLRLKKEQFHLCTEAHAAYSKGTDSKALKSGLTALTKATLEYDNAKKKYATMVESQKTGVLEAYNSMTRTTEKAQYFQTRISQVMRQDASNLADFAAKSPPTWFDTEEESKDDGSTKVKMTVDGEGNVREVSMEGKSSWSLWKLLPDALKGSKRKKQFELEESGSKKRKQFEPEE